jgi:hypothetical protein
MHDANFFIGITAKYQQDRVNELINVYDAGQCCQLLANNFGQINRKIRPLAKKFSRTHYFVLEALFHALLQQVSS